MKGGQPRLPLRTGLREDVHQQESPEQLVSRLTWTTKKRQWRKLQHLLLLLKFMARCNPALASQLAQSGGVSALLGVVRGVLQGSPKLRSKEPVLTAALSLLKKVTLADLDGAIKAMLHINPASCHTNGISTSGSSSSSSHANLLVEVMRDPFSGVQARRKAAQLLRCFVDAGYVNQLLTEGFLKELPTALANPITACDFSFLHDALWCMMALAASEVSIHGMVQQPQPLLGVLPPLLYVMCESRSPHLRHLLAAVLRILHLVAANDTIAKEQLQQLGMIDCLVRVICTDHLATEQHADRAQDPRLAASLAWTSNGSSSDQHGVRSSADWQRVVSSGNGAEPTEEERLQHSPSKKGQWESESGQQQQQQQQQQQLQLDGMGSGGWWWRLWAAALMGPVLQGSQHACTSGCVADGGAAGRAGDGTLENGKDVGEVRSSSEACGGPVSATAVCVYALLLPLQSVPPKVAAAAGQEQQWLCPIKEAFKGLLVMLCADDVNAQWLNDHIIVRSGLALINLVATGDMELAWQAANTLGHLATSPHSSSLVAHGVVEELTYFLQESADALHTLTVRRQLEEVRLTRASSTQLPIPHSAYAYHGRKPAKHIKDRVRLVGRQRVTVNKSWCMYGSHAPTAMCDYCVPSACLRALLRLMSLPAALPSQGPGQPTAGRRNSTPTKSKHKSSGSKGGSPSHCLHGSSSGSSITSSSITSSSSNGHNSSSNNDKAIASNGSMNSVGAGAAGAGSSNSSSMPASAVNQDVAQRFTNSGGLYALFLLLHHELCGVHPSKMASSLLTLLNMVLDASPSCKDEVRKVGGLGLLTALMGSLAKSDRVTDIFQLRVRICCSLQYVLEGNQANKLLAREHGLLDPLVTTLKHATSPDASQVSVLDDGEQVTVSTLDLLATTVDDSRGNQAALIAAGGLPLLHDLLMKPSISPAVLMAVVRVFELMVHGCEPAKLAMLGTPALPHLVTLCSSAPDSLLAQRVVALCCRLVSEHAQGKAKVLASGVLPLLLKMLHTSPYGAHTSAASQGLYAVTLGDVDLQNEVAAQGGFHAIESIIQGSPLLCSHALWLLCCLMYGNSYMKNEARQAGFVKLLMDLSRTHGIKHPEITVPALHALAQMCQSNSVNQRAVVDEGGMHMVCAYMQRILGVGVGSTKAGTTPATAAQGSLASAMMHPAVLDAVVRLLGSLVEFNTHNQGLARESGCLALTADWLMLAAEVHDLDMLHGAQLLPAVSAACAAVARAAQDCETNQLWLMHRHEDLAAALFRLLSVDEPYVALDTSRALEFVAIRSDQVVSAGEDRAEFEADAVRAIVRIMHSRGDGPVHAPSAAVAAAAAVLGGQSSGSSSSGSFSKGGAAAGVGGGATSGKKEAGGVASSSGRSQVTSYTVQETARVLVSILCAVPGVPNPNPPPSNQQPKSNSSTTRTGGLLRGFTRAGKKAPQNPPPPIATTTTTSTDLPATPEDADAAHAANVSSSPTTDSPQGVGAPSGYPPQPSLVSLSSLTPDPRAGPHGWGMGDRRQLLQQQQFQQQQEQQQGSLSQGPVQNGSLGQRHNAQQHHHKGRPQGSTDSMPQQPVNPPQDRGAVRRLMCIEQWTKQSGCSPASFQAIAATVGGGPWHYVKLQLAWVLFLLAAKSRANRALIEQLVRTVVSPLAQQLANEEAFYASDEAFAALTMQAPENCPAAPLPISTLASDKQQQQQQQQLQAHHQRTSSYSRSQQGLQQGQHQRQPSASSAQQQQQQQQQGAAFNSSVVPSAPDPNPLQHGPAFPSNPTGMARPGGAAAPNHTSASSASDDAGERGDRGAANDEMQGGGVRSNSAEGDDELSMIEAEVAMLANFGSVAPMPRVSRGSIDS